MGLAVAPTLGPWETLTCSCVTLTPCGVLLSCCLGQMGGASAKCVCVGGGTHTHPDTCACGGEAGTGRRRREPLQGLGVSPGPGPGNQVFLQEECGSESRTIRGLHFYPYQG